MANKSPKRKTHVKAPPGTAPSSPIQNRWLHENGSLLAAGAIFLAHVLGLASIFSSWTSVFSSAPLISQDWGLHFHHLGSLEAFWRQDRMVWGYNPFFMAGYPSNTIQDLSIKLFEFAALGLSTFALTSLQWFKISAFTAMASVPWLIYFTAQNFFTTHDHRNVIALAATFLATVYWWNSLPREMFFYGMIGFPAACYLSVWGVSLFFRLALHPDSFGPVHLAWLVFASAILPLHVQSSIVFLPPAAAILLSSRGMLNGKLAAWIAAAALLSLSINAVWLLPALSHRADDVSSVIVDQLPLFASSNPFTFILDYLGPQGFWTFRPAFFEKGFRIALLGLGVIGIRRLLHDGNRTAGMLLATAVTALFIIAYFGALISLLKPWQPLRFKVPLDLFLVISAAYAVAQWHNARGSARAFRVPIILLGGLFTFLINLAQTESTGKLQLRAGLNPESIAVAEWITRETPVTGRVLFEESGDETGFVHGGAYLSSFLPYLTGRQIIGGPINLYNDRHHFAEFHSAKIFKREVQRISDQELQDYLRLYNIGAVVAFHPASIKRLQSIPRLVTLEQRFGPVHLMKVNQPLTWFIKGSGKVTAGFNRLELAELTGDEVILKYHWIDGLTASPPVKIEPIKIADDPIPFIKLINPPARVVLRAGALD